MLLNSGESAPSIARTSSGEKASCLNGIERAGLGHAKSEEGIAINNLVLKSSHKHRRKIADILYDGRLSDTLKLSVDKRASLGAAQRSEGHIRPRAERWFKRASKATLASTRGAEIRRNAV